MCECVYVCLLAVPPGAVAGPTAAWTLILAYVGGVLLLLVLIVYGKRKRVNISALSIGVDFLYETKFRYAILAFRVSVPSGHEATAMVHWHIIPRPLLFSCSLCRQIVSIFTSFGFKWPIGLRSIFTASSAASFNDQLLAPECSVQGWNFESKWFATQLLPAVFVFILAVLAAVNVVAVSPKMGCSTHTAHSSNVVVSTPPASAPRT